MACLGAISYDPATAVTSNSTASLLAMTAVDTTNLRLTFTPPANGSVQVRIKCQAHGATTEPRIFLGVLDGSTIRGRMVPSGQQQGTLLATNQWGQEVTYVVTGLTPSNSYTWDAAYGVDVVAASTAIKYGGPDNATGDDAFGAFQFEIWEATNLLAAKLYDPASSVTKSLTSLLAMTALDTTNLRNTFTAPASGRVFWRFAICQHGTSTFGQPMLGMLEGSTVRARTTPIISNPAPSVSGGSLSLMNEASGVITGLTGGNSYSFDAAYGVETVAGAGGFKYGGPDDTTTNNAFGGCAFEIWVA
jgi:hypothetical protein